MNLKFYVINLKSASQRLKKIKNNLNHFNIKFDLIEAVDGNKLISNQYLQKYNSQRKYYKPLLKGEIGCYLSHINTWKKIINDKVDYGIVFEDDITIDDRLINFIGDLKKSTLPKKVMIKLVSSERKAYTIFHHLDNSIKLVKEFPISCSTVAYMISLAGAKQLFQKMSLTRPIDIDLEHDWEHGVEILTTKPDLIIKENFSTTIDNDEFSRTKIPKRFLLQKIIFELSFNFFLFQFNKRKLGWFHTMKLLLRHPVDLTSKTNQIEEL